MSAHVVASSPTRRAIHARALSLAGEYRRRLAFYLAELPDDHASHRGAAGLAWHYIRHAQTVRMVGLARLPR